MNEEKVTAPQVTAPRRYEPISQDHARKLVELMVKEFQPSSFRPGGATWAELMRKSGMKESTYQRALDWCIDHEWLVGGGGRNLRYDLNPNGKWKAAFQSSRSLSPGAEAMKVKKSPSVEVNWGLSGGDSNDSIVALASEAIRHANKG
jgi:hypothetical protein